MEGGCGSPAVYASVSSSADISPSEFSDSTPRHSPINSPLPDHHFSYYDHHPDTINNNNNGNNDYSDSINTSRDYDDDDGGGGGDDNTLTKSRCSKMNKSIPDSTGTDTNLPNEFEAPFVPTSTSDANQRKLGESPAEHTSILLQNAPFANPDHIEVDNAISPQCHGQRNTPLLAFDRPINTRRKSSNVPPEKRNSSTHSNDSREANRGGYGVVSSFDPPVNRGRSRRVSSYTRPRDCDLQAGICTPDKLDHRDNTRSTSQRRSLDSDSVFTHISDHHDSNNRRSGGKQSNSVVGTHFEEDFQTTRSRKISIPSARRQRTSIPCSPVPSHSLPSDGWYNSSHSQPVISPCSDVSHIRYTCSPCSDTSYLGSVRSPVLSPSSDVSYLRNASGPSVVFTPSSDGSQHHRYIPTGPANSNEYTPPPNSTSYCVDQQPQRADNDYPPTLTDLHHRSMLKDRSPPRLQPLSMRRPRSKPGHPTSSSFDGGSPLNQPSDSSRPLSTSGPMQGCGASESAEGKSSPSAAAVTSPINNWRSLSNNNNVASRIYNHVPLTDTINSSSSSAGRHRRTSRTLSTTNTHSTANTTTSTTATTKKNTEEDLVHYGVHYARRRIPSPLMSRARSSSTSVAPRASSADNPLRARTPSPVLRLPSKQGTGERRTCTTTASASTTTTPTSTSSSFARKGKHSTAEASTVKRRKSPFAGKQKSQIRQRNTKSFIG